MINNEATQRKQNRSLTVKLSCAVKVHKGKNVMPKNTTLSPVKQKLRTQNVSLLSHLDPKRGVQLNEWMYMAAHQKQEGKNHATNSFRVPTKEWHLY